jgi:hypothetical protein
MSMTHYQNADYLAGKRDRLAGKALPPMPEKGRHSQSQCDYRSGWVVADSNKRSHPDWSDAQILS